MKKALLVAALLGCSAMLSTTANAQFLCSYSTWISNDDKYSSNGKYLASGANKSAAAAILRQNRVYSGSTACGLHNTQNRANFEAKVRRSSISPQTIRKIVYGNPSVTVEIYTSHVVVY